MTTSKWKKSVKRTLSAKSPGYRKPDLEIISPEKLIHASKHGMKVLLPRIKLLREQLEPLQTAYIRLTGKKHFAELASTEVQFIPEGASSRNPKRIKTITEQVEEMSPQQMDALLKSLEDRKVKEKL